MVTSFLLLPLEAGVSSLHAGGERIGFVATGGPVPAGYFTLSGAREGRYPVVRGELREVVETLADLRDELRAELEFESRLA